MTNSNPSPRRALVLGCGGVAGGAWSIAALHHLEQQLDWDARDADILIGTSAGAVLATLLGSGISVDQLLACQQGTNEQCRWDHDSDSGGALPPLPGARFTGAKLALKGLRGDVSPLTAFCGLLPRGQFDMAPFRQLVDDATGGADWVAHPATWIMAVDTTSGKRVAFGKGGAPQAHIRDAVCASYGVPFWCPPVSLGSRTYIDGGVVVKSWTVKDGKITSGKDSSGNASGYYYFWSVETGYVQVPIERTIIEEIRKTR
mgnify:CR=1 FL=1